ncbi:MAG: HAD family phosphatase [Acidobacteriota bacterium]
MSTRLPDRLRPPAAVLFDLDGTLVDSEPLHLQAQLVVMERRGASMGEDEFSEFIGWAEEPFWTEMCRRYRLDASPRELAEERTEILLGLFEESPPVVLPGVRELLELLERRSVPRAVASSSPRRLIEAALHAASLRELVPTWRSGHDDVAPGRGKPSPDVYLAAAAALDVDAKDCLAVEDSTTGLTAALAAGCHAIAVPCPSHPDPGLDDADLRLESLHELVADLS